MTRTVMGAGGNIGQTFVAVEPTAWILAGGGIGSGGQWCGSFLRYIIKKSLTSGKVLRLALHDAVIILIDVG